MLFYTKANSKSQPYPINPGDFGKNETEVAAKQEHGAHSLTGSQGPKGPNTTAMRTLGFHACVHTYMSIYIYGIPPGTYPFIFTYLSLYVGCGPGDKGCLKSIPIQPPTPLSILS